MSRDYLQAAQAMQAGVRLELGKKHPQFGDAMNAALKHLRVGINCAMSDHGALAVLLLEKGIITEDEYNAKLLEFMEREVASYEKRLNVLFGGDTDIVLG